MKAAAAVGVLAVGVGVVVLGGGGFNSPPQNTVIQNKADPPPAAAVAVSDDGPVGGAGWEKVPAAYRPMLLSAAKKSGCALATPQLMAGLIDVESQWNPKAVSPAGAKGLTQIMDNTLAAAGITNAFDPAQSIVGGARVLCKKEAATRGNSAAPIVRALAAYNGGEGMVRAGRPIPAIVARYAEKVVAESRKYTAVPAAKAGKTPPPPGKQAKGGKAMGYKAQIAVIKAAFPDAIITSTFRPGAISSSKHPSMHGMGRAIDIGRPTAAMFNWIAKNYPDSAELIYTPMGGRQLKNGKMVPQSFWGGTVARDHYNHIHWGM